jgi:hypothetical protein
MQKTLARILRIISKSFFRAIRFFICGICAEAVFAAAIPAALAQQNIPHLAYILPAGGQQGTSFQVKIGGQFLTNITGVLISGSGVETRIVENVRPMNANQAMQLRDRLQELQKQPMSAENRQEFIDIRVKLIMFQYERNISPVLAETVILQVDIALNAEPGNRELRVMSPQGLSNPVTFQIGRLQEFTEKESFDVKTPPGTPIPQPQITQPPTDLQITIPALVNGRIKPTLPRAATPARPGEPPFTPGDADRYRFEARQGQHLVIAACARDLTPYLADAVPGWFQAVITLYDADGKEVAYNDDFRFHPDPVLHYEVPKDGEYFVEIRDALYRGREDFVYRLAIGELPYMTGIYPMGGMAGTQTELKFTGWNLPSDTLALDLRSRDPGWIPISVKNGNLSSNILSYAIDSLPEKLEKEPNDGPKNAQKITLPAILNGQINRTGDWDVFSFSGHTGEEIVAEVIARRLGSPLDSVLRVTDSSGRQLSFNDDFEDKGAGMETHHADSLISMKLPSDGTYFLYLGDAQSKGGTDYAYRLRISSPRPGFELRVTPSAINIAPGTSVPITAYAIRKDGFSGEIQLTLSGAPRGFALSGASIPAGQDSIRLTLTAPQLQVSQPFSIRIDGRANIQGIEISHPAQPAEDSMQAFAYRHLVVADDLRVAVRRGAAFRAPARVIGANPLKMVAGSVSRIRVAVQLPPNSALEKFDYELSEPPEGITIREVVPAQDGVEIVLACDASKTKPGMKGNLIIELFGVRNPPANGQGQATRQRVALGTLPAIPFEMGIK